MKYMQIGFIIELLLVSIITGLMWWGLIKL